ncbi:MAG TPA: hypothetical protein VLH81_14545 [Desulfobacterales bacterium]|nr:hypothetical protein [Desulfobacterales bacterium]
MTVMVYSEHGDTWVAHPSVLEDLKALTDSPGDLLLLSGNSGTEISDLTKFFNLFAAAGGNAERLGVASHHPTLQWLRDVRGAGYTKTWFCTEPLVPGSRLLDRVSLVEVPRDVCPALHVRQFDGRPTSVCGNRLDRLVLGPRMMRGQCFGRWSECRWAVAARAATRADQGELACT